MRRARPARPVGRWRLRGDRIRANLDVRTDRCDRYGRPPAPGVGVGVGVDGRGRRPGVPHRVDVAVRRGLRDDGLRGRGRARRLRRAVHLLGRLSVVERDPRVDRAVSVERGRRSRGDVASIVFLRAKTFAQIGASRAPRREYSRAFVDAETRVWGWMRSIEADPRAIARRSPRDSPERVPPAAASVCCQIDEKQKFDRARRSPHAPPTVEGAEKGAAVGFLSSDGAIREVRESPRRFAARAPRQCRAARNPRGCSGSSPPISRTPATRCQVTLVSGRCLAFFGKFHDCLHVKTRGPTVSLSFFFWLVASGRDFLGGCLFEAWGAR